MISDNKLQKKVACERIGSVSVLWYGSTESEMMKVSGQMYVPVDMLPTAVGRHVHTAQSSATPLNVADSGVNRQRAIEGMGGESKRRMRLWLLMAYPLGRAIC